MVENVDILCTFSLISVSDYAHILQIWYCNGTTVQTTVVVQVKQQKQQGKKLETK